MSSRQCLRFLRPYLLGFSPTNKTPYARFFSAACHQPIRIRAYCHSLPGSIPYHKGLHSSVARSSSDAGPPTPTDAAEASPSRAVTVEGRVQKLKEYDVLRYPRLDSRPDRMRIPSFRAKYQDETSTPASEEVVLEGRAMSVRRVGPKLVFISLVAGYERVQIMISLNGLSSPPTDEQFKEALHPFRRGDIISVVGKAVRTEKGELSLKVTELPKILSPSLASLPHRLVNEETMVLNRHVDMLVNARAADLLRLRMHIIRGIRSFLSSNDFLEVQTPMLADYAGGAAARPFLTSATEFPQKELALRIAPELWLKRLVVGGHDRVFEIGQAFRNEGLDTTHNPEFTTCEFYSAYSNLPDLISITEELITRIRWIVTQAIEHQLKSLQKPTVKLPREGWRQLEFVPALEERIGFQFPDLAAPDAFNTLKVLLSNQGNLPRLPDMTLNKLLDHLAATHLEVASFEQPLFIIHHPACMSPLSKSFICPKTGQLVSARAELFIEGREIANMYEEENDPFEQRRKFELQVQTRANNAAADDEGPAEVDESYIQALEHGLPPTGGWGCGIERLVMLFSGAPRISDTLSFGNLRNVVSLSQAAKNE